ncbi:MAG: hypothetical protein RSC07_00375 [Mucinivorans sp.]
MIFGCLSQFTSAQIASSMSVFSPYTMYGIGDLHVGGGVANRAMGGIGVAWQSAVDFNYLNPASLGAISQHSAIFQFAGEGQNHYSRTTAYNQYGAKYQSSASHNNFDIHDLGFAIPLARGIGLGFSLTPVSGVGYRTSMIDSTTSVVNNIGRAVYGYRGEGGISAVTMSFGINLVKGLNVGANMIYYFGTMDRYYNADIYPMLNADTYRAVKSYSKVHVSKLSFSVGAQYSVRLSKTGWLTFGGTYQPNTNINTYDRMQSVSVTGNTVDTVYIGEKPMSLNIPQKWAVGVMYQSAKWSFGFDYDRQDWTDAFDTDVQNTGISLGVQQQYKLGVSYTPNRMSIRSAFNRWTYKLGARYGTSYILKDGQQLQDIAITLGFDFPLKAKSNSKISVGAEVGKRGTQYNGQVREDYFKIFVGITFIGEDGWFRQYKLN